MLSAALLVLTAVSAAPSAPPIRAGTYDIVVTYGGGELQGTLKLTYVADTIAVVLQVGEHSPAIKSVTRDGSRLTLTGGAEGMAMVYKLAFDGDSVSGTFVFSDADGTVTGKRRTAGS